MISKTDIIQNIKQVSSTIQTIPTREQYFNLGDIGISTVIRKFGSWNKAVLETFGEVKTKSKSKTIKTHCNQCGKEIGRTKNTIKINNFCSNSCSASFNNKKHPKRTMTKTCRTCKNLINTSHTFCSNCISLGKHKKTGSNIEDRPLSYYIKKKKDANRYCGVRQHACRITSSRPQKCKVCEYDKHIETCHIKDIASFSPETLIKEVNHPDNLVLLCKNHHWELDHKILKLNGS